MIQNERSRELSEKVVAYHSWMKEMKSKNIGTIGMQGKVPKAGFGEQSAHGANKDRSVVVVEWIRGGKIPLRQKNMTEI